MAWFIVGTFYVAMAAAALVVEFLFQAFGLIPTPGAAHAATLAITFKYTTVLDLIFLAVAAALLRRFLKTGGPAVLRMMKAPPDWRPPLSGRFDCVVLVNSRSDRYSRR